MCRFFSQNKSNISKKNNEKKVWEMVVICFSLITWKKKLCPLLFKHFHLKCTGHVTPYVMCGDVCDVALHHSHI